MSDIEKSFTYLQDNIPQWLQDISNVEEKVTAMQEENTKVFISQSPFGNRRSDSIESIQPARLDSIAEAAAPSNGTNTGLAGSRKRKLLSVSSGRVSNSSRHRKIMVVVSYDGDVQKLFELIVRAIGTGRNMLRKAKMEAKMNEMAAQAESSDDDDDVDDAEDNIMLSRDNYRSRMSSLRARSAARRSGRLGVSGALIPAALFETTDKTLEQAQELCEKAAHLTLRDGDCRTELGGVRKAFGTLLETAKAEVEKCNALKSQDPPELQPHETSDTSVSSTEPETKYRKHIPQPSLPVADLDPQSKTTLSTAPTASDTAPPKIVDIEVDDDDESDDDFVMPPVRLTSRHNRWG
jgi:hypothetical protein